jgi:hypothetical protein
VFIGPAAARFVVKSSVGRFGAVVARVPAKPKPGEGWSRANRSERWIGFSEDDGNNRRRRRYLAAAPSRSRRTNALRTTRSTPPKKKSKKSLAMPARIVKNGVILRILGGTMRKHKTCSRRSLPFRLLVILAGAFLLLAAFAPRANADCPACIRFYDMENPSIDVVGLGSHQPAIEQGDNPPFSMRFLNNDGTNYDVGNLTAANVPTVGNVNLPANANPNNLSLVVHRSGTANLNIVFTFPSVAGIYDIQSVSFASAGSGNGFQNVQLQMSTNGGLQWTDLSVNTSIPSTITTIVLNNTLNVGGTVGQPNLLIRLHFTNGQSNGTDTQNIIDNIQVNGTVAPEPATVAGGLLGVLGLCWFQRRRLIRHVRLRRT